MIHLALLTPAIDAETFPCDILSPFYYDQNIWSNLCLSRQEEPMSRWGLGWEWSSPTIKWILPGALAPISALLDESVRGGRSFVNE